MQQQLLSLFTYFWFLNPNIICKGASGEISLPVTNNTVIISPRLFPDLQSNYKMQGIFPDIKVKVQNGNELKSSKVKRIVNDPPGEENCTCGLSVAGNSACSSNVATLSRIVGGQPVGPQKNKHPWQTFVRICNGNSPTSKCYMCGGTLISRNFVLTAAHCFQNNKSERMAKNVVVSLGDYDLRVNTEKGQRVFQVVETIVHPNYDSTVVENDIALLRLNSDVSFSQDIRPACLPKGTDDKYSGKLAVISGWGSLQYQGTTSPILREGSVRILDSGDPNCIRGAVVDSVPVTKMCAYAPGIDACQGDSGGPLTLQEQDRCSVVGIVSYGFECAAKNHAGIYTRVNQFLPWIRSYIGEGQCGNSSSSSTAAGPSSQPNQTAAEDGPPCDLTCTNVGKKTGNFGLNGVEATCRKGICTGFNGVDLCDLLNNPCKKEEENIVFPTEDPAKCKSPCNLSFYISAYMNNADFPTIIELNVYGISVQCNQITGICCQTGDPNKILCAKVFLAFIGIGRRTRGIARL